MESSNVLGELIPVGGGDTIPLIRSPLVLGRRESCDICLEFPNVSGKHCQLIWEGGIWVLQDLNSTNGVKVNGLRVAKEAKKLLQPGDMITIAKRSFKIQYVLSKKLSEMTDFTEEIDNILKIPLMERAGLEKPKRPNPNGRHVLDDDDDDD